MDGELGDWVGEVFGPVAGLDDAHVGFVKAIDHENAPGCGLGVDVAVWGAGGVAQACG